jgi:YVTN family beta-propeller protein
MRVGSPSPTRIDQKIMKPCNIGSSKLQRPETGSIRLNFNREFLLSIFTVLIAACPTVQAIAQEASDEISADAGPANKVIATIDVGTGPHLIVLSPKADLAYVANYLGNTISVIDTTTNSVTNTFTSVGASPDGLAITPDGTELYVANEISSGTVSILNASTGAIEKTITVGDNPRYLSISPNGKLVYVANENSGTISVIDTSTQTVKTSITIGEHAASAAFSTNSKIAYACEDGSGHVYEINTATSQIEHSISTVGDPLNCVVNPKGGDVYCTNFAIATVSVIKGDKITKTFQPGGVPAAPGITPNGKYLYFPQYYSSGTNYGDTVIVVSTKTYKQVGPAITVGTGPSWVAISKKGDLAYVSNYEANSVSVIQITPGQ